MTRIISIINFTLATLLLALCGTAWLFLHSPDEFPQITPKLPHTQLPKNLFTQPDMAYQAISEGPFAVNWTPPSMQLPDLREEILYYGKNGRPDISPGDELITITLKSSLETKTVHPGQKIYLVYRHGYHFAPGAKPTSLWIDLCSKKYEDLLAVHVHMVNENRQLVKTPEECAEFEVNAKEFSRTQATNWELGGCRVDTTLLVRQRARWLGPDLFLDMHGGDEFLWAKDKQRIDFMADVPYACFVQEGDFLIWKEGKWAVAQGQSTVGYPLLIVKKMDDKLMAFELWDVDGRSKATLHLIRTKEASFLPNLAEEFKFVGAKTWSQFVVESRQDRMIIKPNDWLVLSEGCWKKIASSQEVDDYVNLKLTGPLFILDKMKKQNGVQVLIGHLFNASRTEVIEVELPAQPCSLAYKPLGTPNSLKTGASGQEKETRDISSHLADKAHKLSREMYKNLRGDSHE